MCAFYTEESSYIINIINLKKNKHHKLKKKIMIAQVIKWLAIG